MINGNRMIVGAILAIAGLSEALAAPYTVCDFEDYEIGTSLPMWNYYGGQAKSEAVVEADPSNPDNKVLHVTHKSWNDYLEFTLPDNLSGKALTDRYDYLDISLYRHPDDQAGEWMQFMSRLGSDELFIDANFISYGPTSVWSTHTYTLASAPESSEANKLHIAFNSDKAEYYIDNVVLKGRYDNYVIYESGKLDFSNPASTSSAYTEYSTPINIPSGTALDVYTSRYTYWMSPLIGEGRLNIYGGGERSYLGNAKGAEYPDWTEYTGDIHIYPYPEVNPSVSAGFYGVVMAHGGKKFNSDNIEESITKRNLTTIWENNHVTLHAGATIAAESNNTARAFRIARLSTEKGSVLTGYYKSSSYRAYYLVGHSGEDSELAGEISPVGSSKIGLIKEGKGTYTITGNTNNINGGLSVIEGCVLVNNDIAEARESRLSGGVGTSSNSSVAVAVYPGATLGGNGNIAGLTDVYGTLQPGTDQPGTLSVADYTSTTKINLRVRPTARLKFRLNSPDSYGKLDIAGNLEYYNITSSLEQSDQMPVVELILPQESSLSVGDSFTLISASGKSSLNDIEWNFRIQYPTSYTWSVEQSLTAEGYQLTATITSLDYSGQGDEIIEIKPEKGDDNSAFYVDYSADFTDSTPIREYAAKSGKRIGLAASAEWRYDITDATNPKVKTIAEQFNMIVAENEMKFDATEPQQGVFDFTKGDKIADFAIANSMYLRGHALVWHSQCPEWVSSDGKKNNLNWTRQQLLEIMDTHIENVAGHYKGKVNEWDVVNEMLDDDQSTVRSNPDSFTLRKTVWETAIGEDYIIKALETAHRVDPDAKLFINEYGAEFMGDAKSEALYNLAKSLVDKGAPLHGVGLQCHLTVGEIKVAKLLANIKRYEELGLECIITELDIAQLDPKAVDAQEQQAKEYGALVNAALSQPNCPSVMVWGLSDSDSWRENNPLLYDNDMNAKDAYYAVHAVYRQLAESSGIEDAVIDTPEGEIISTEYYNLQGVRVAETYEGVMVRLDRYNTGRVVVSKIRK